MGVSFAWTVHLEWISSNIQKIDRDFMTNSLIETSEWQALQQHFQSLSVLHLQDLFRADEQRGTKFAIDVAGIYIDFSKNHIQQETVELLVNLARHCQLDMHIQALFSGGLVNYTEKAPALHTALRDLNQKSLYINSTNVMPLIRDSFEQVKLFIEEIREHRYCGYSGKAITDVVNIGIGGSHLGPLLLYQSLKSPHQWSGNCHFISNQDETHFLEIIEKLNPETTLFIIVSKSFTTAETLQNFHRAKRWLLQYVDTPSQIYDQLIAVTAHRERAIAEEFLPNRIFPIWSWIGGRFSIWSAVSLATMIAIGWDRFFDFLNGALSMDQHFKEMPLERNAPVLLALISIWYRNFFNYSAHAMIPYSHRLRQLPEYLQQLHMESQGKHRRRDGSLVPYATGGVIFGGVGTDIQHSFQQFFLQGTTRIPVDFILPIKNVLNHVDQLELLSNCLGQSIGLMQGNESIELHRAIIGNNPSTTILMDDLVPFQLGALLALYEHKVYVQSVIWNINPFDQWGVEHGKKLANHVLRAWEDHELRSALDSSTQALMTRIRNVE